MINKDEIKDHTQIVASCGTHVDIVVHLDWEHIKLAKSDPVSNGQHHYIPLNWVDKVEDNKVTLLKNSKEVFSEWRNA